MSSYCIYISKLTHLLAVLEASCHDEFLFFVKQVEYSNMESNGVGLDVSHVGNQGDYDNRLKSQYCITALTKYALKSDKLD